METEVIVSALTFFVLSTAIILYVAHRHRQKRKYAEMKKIDDEKPDEKPSEKEPDISIYNGIVTRRTTDKGYNFQIKRYGRVAVLISIAFGIYYLMFFNIMF